MKITEKIKISPPSIAIIVFLVMMAVYFLFDPVDSAWLPKCIFLKLTGWQCPGCGMQRMFHALLHGDLAAAWHYNAFLLCFLPVLLFMVWLEFSRKKHPRLYIRFYSLPTIIIISTMIVAWFFIRNFFL